MTGKEAFEKLSKMTENQRKECFFFFVSDKTTIRHHLSDIVFDEKNSVDEEILKQSADEITSDEVSEIITQSESEISDYSFNGYYEEYMGILYDKLREKLQEKLEKKNIKLVEE
jgi:hypothetical protein